MDSGFSSYNNTTTKPYKPDLLAPGVNIVLPSTRDSSTATPTAWGGTSLSAPIVTSAVAQLCEASSVLKYNPMLMKAAVLAGSKITGNMTVSTTLNRQYGAGMVNVLNSFGSIVTRGNYASGTISTSTNTISHTMNIADFESTYNIGEKRKAKFKNQINQSQHSSSANRIIFTEHLIFLKL